VPHVVVGEVPYPIRTWRRFCEKGPRSERWTIPELMQPIYWQPLPIFRVADLNEPIWVSPSP